MHYAKRSWPILLVLYGVLNAAAYSALLPLWEGFDEAYHYGYVQFVSTHLALPVLGRATLSEEIWHSMQLVPVSPYLQGFTRAPVSFPEYDKLSEQERVDRRLRLESLPAAEKYRPQPDKSNYEVNQSPLPYLWMALADRVLSGFSLFTRVLWVRWLCSIPAVLLLAHAARLLAGQIALPPVYANAMLFCVFSSQMLYATVCRISNDWLAVPLFTYLVWAVIRAQERGSVRNCVTLAAIFAAALLTKAYFLFLAPLVFGTMIWLMVRRRISLARAALFSGVLALIAGPWFIRNLILYGDFSATSEKTAGAGPGELVQAALHLPWLRSIGYMAHSSLWTGNNSFTTFSSATLNILLLLLAASLALGLVRGKPSAAKRLLLAAILIFCAGLAFITITFFAASKGDVWAAVPWYMQVLLVPVLSLPFLGLSGAGPWGPMLLRATVLIWGYVLAATYLVKLVPLYGAFPDTHAHFANLWNWYTHMNPTRESLLRTVCLAHPKFLWILITAAIAVDAALCLFLMQSNHRIDGGGSQDPHNCYL